MPLLKGGPKRWKWTEIILKSDKLIVNVVVFKLCNSIWVFMKSKGEKKIGGVNYWLTLEQYVLLRKKFALWFVWYTGKRKARRQGKTLILFPFENMKCILIASWIANRWLAECPVDTNELIMERRQASDLTISDHPASLGLTQLMDACVFENLPLAKLRAPRGVCVGGGGCRIDTGVARPLEHSIPNYTLVFSRLVNRAIPHFPF